MEDEPGRVIPNPLRRGSGIEWGAGRLPVKIEVFDVNGRVVRVFGPAGAGGLRATWDGRSESGRELQTGVYLLRISQGDSVLRRRVLYLR